MSETKLDGIWLEVSNVRLGEKELVRVVEVQVKGDKEEREPAWWPVADTWVNPKGSSDASDNAAKVYREIAEGLDKKRIVLAWLAPKNVSELEIKAMRVQFADSNVR